MHIVSYPSIEHFQSNNWCAQPGTGKTDGPKQTYISHSERFFDKKKVILTRNVVPKTMEHVPKHKNE